MRSLGEGRRPFYASPVRLVLLFPVLGDGQAHDTVGLCLSGPWVKGVVHRPQTFQVSDDAVANLEVQARISQAAIEVVLRCDGGRPDLILDVPALIHAVQQGTAEANAWGAVAPYAGIDVLAFGVLGVGEIGPVVACRRAVNPMEAVYWFNDVQGPKKGFFHQDGHQYVDRDDYFDTELAWFDHYLKGIDNGVDRMPVVEVITNTDKIRLDDEWPPSDATPLSLSLGPGSLTATVPADGTEDYRAALALNAVSGTTGLPAEDAVRSQVAPDLEYRSGPLAADLYMAGNAVMHLRAASDQTNTYFLFDLVDEAPDGQRTFVSEGWFNAHLREGFDHSAPLTPGTPYDFRFKFEPRDYVFEEGHQILLLLKGTNPGVLPFDTPAATNTVHYGPEASWLELPILDDPVLFDRTVDTGPAT